MALSYIGLYSTYYYNRNNVPLVDDTPIINRNYRFKIKKYVPKDAEDERPVNSTVSLNTKYKAMKVERADMSSKKKAQSAQQKEEDDTENYRITQEFFLSKERDLALNKNGVKLTNKKLLMGDNERRAIKQNPLEDKNMLSASKVLDGQLNFNLSQVKLERGKLLDKYIEIDFALKEIEKKRNKEIEHEMHEISKKKRHELSMKLNEMIKNKLLEVDEDGEPVRNDKNKMNEFDVEIKVLRKKWTQELEAELKQIKKDKLLQFQIELNTKRFEKINDLNLKETKEKSSMIDINRARNTKSAPPSKSARINAPFEKFLTRQSNLLENLAKYYNVDEYEKLPSRQHLYTPTGFKPFAENLQDKIYEQKHKYYPDSFNKRKIKAKITVGYHELMHSPEKLQRYRDTKICSKRKEHDLAEFKAQSYVDLKHVAKKYPNVIINTVTLNSKNADNALDSNNVTAENYTDVKDFSDLSYLAKRFPQVIQILINGQQNIDFIKGSNNAKITS